MMRRTWVILGALVFPASLAGQTVKQGDASAVPVDPMEFHSPMVMEVVFAPGDPTLWVSDEWTPKNGKAWKRGDFTTAEYHGLGRYSCDGLSLRRDYNRGRNTWESGLAMHVKTLSGGKTEVVIMPSVSNPGHGTQIHDKVVTLIFEILNGEETIATTSTAIKVRANWLGKEEEYGHEVKLLLRTAALKPTTKLRITMTTRDY